MACVFCNFFISSISISSICMTSYSLFWMRRCSSSIWRAMAVRVSVILRRRVSSAFCLAICSSNLTRDFRSRFSRLIYSSCYCLRALSC